MAPANKLIISPAANDDLRNIFRYGTLNWGAACARDYLSRIKERLWHLRLHPEMGLSREDLLPGIRSLTIGGHVIFYRPRTRQIEIVRVLHGRQAPQRHLGTAE